MADTDFLYLCSVKQLVFNIEPTSFADLLAVTTYINSTEMRSDIIVLVAAMTQAGLSFECVQFEKLELKYINKDALLLRFDADDTERLQSRWIEAFKKLVKSIEEDGLLEQIRKLTV